MQAIQATGPTGCTVPEILLAELLTHPALAHLQPDERAALHQAAERLERLPSDGITLRVRIAHVGDLVPISLMDARAAVYCTTGTPRELHVWINGDDLNGKSGMTVPVLLQVLAAAAGLPLAGEPRGAAARLGSGTLNAITEPLDDEVQPVAIQRPVGEDWRT